MRLAGAVVSLLLLFSAAFFFVYWDVNRLINPGKASYHLESGSGLSDFTSKLQSRGVIDREWTLLLWAAVYRQTNDVKAGEFRFQDPTTLSAILDQLRRGDVVTYRVTLFEGSTTAQMRASLKLAPALTRILPTLEDKELREIVGIKSSLSEGWFFPDTYFYTRGDTDVSILKRAHKRMNDMLKQAWANRRPGLLLKRPYEALILASIVEREALRDAEKSIIAGVFIKRLGLGMRLQADPTVIYGLGDHFDGDLTRKDLESDTPYNSYTRAGLPPTPISSPGRVALNAATRPSQTKYLYFVARGDGTHLFSETYKQHQRAVAKFQSAN